MIIPPKTGRLFVSLLPWLDLERCRQRLLASVQTSGRINTANPAAAAAAAVASAGVESRKGAIKPEDMTQLTVRDVCATAFICTAAALHRGKKKQRQLVDATPRLSSGVGEKILLLLLFFFSVSVTFTSSRQNSLSSLSVLLMYANGFTAGLWQRTRPAARQEVHTVGKSRSASLPNQSGSWCSLWPRPPSFAVSSSVHR